VTAAGVLVRLEVPLATIRNRLLCRLLAERAVCGWEVRATRETATATVAHLHLPRQTDPQVACRVVANALGVHGIREGVTVAPYRPDPRRAGRTPRRRPA
jgi:hypothetical protein